jgi:hypothetical protein
MESFFLHSSSVKQWVVRISQVTAGFRREVDENLALHRRYIRLFKFRSRAKKGNPLFSVCFEKSLLGNRFYLKSGLLDQAHGKQR